MTTLDVLVVIQARMSSERFPGKVLAPLHGEPILRHVVRAAETAVARSAIVIATSDDRSDDPVAAYGASLGLNIVRGPLDDVLERFRLCSRRFPSEWILRINADSPMLPPATIEQLLKARTEGAFDLVTTVFPRTFPSGQNVELIRSKTLSALPDDRLTAADREHVTTFIYRNFSEFAIRNIESAIPSEASLSFAVDTLDDLRRLERLSDTAVR